MSINVEPTTEQRQSIRRITVILTDSQWNTGIFDDVSDADQERFMDAFADTVEANLSIDYGENALDVKVRRHQLEQSIAIEGPTDIEDVDTITADVEAWIETSFKNTTERWTCSELEA